MKIIDLTHKIEEEMTVFDESERPIIKKNFFAEKDGFTLTELKIFSHTGTHIDGPLHLFEEGKSLNDFPLENFIGKALQIEVKDSKIITLELIKKFPIENYDFILFNSGYGELFNSDDYLKGYPVLESKATEFLANSSIKGVGFDLISPDKMEDSNLSNHKILLGKEKIIIENLANLSKAPKEFVLSILPIKFDLNDGSPVRAVAICEI
ncbi:MAG: cyclase family protein [Sarcina sp.]